MNKYLIGLIFVINANVFAANNALLYEEVPQGELFVAGLISGVQFSPDGDQMMFKYWTPEGEILQIYNNVQNKITHRFRLPNANRRLYWLTNDQLVYEYKGMIFRSDLDGGNIELMINWKIDDVDSRADKKNKWWDFRKLIPGKKGEILISSYYKHLSLHTYNIYTGEKEDLFDGEKLKIDGWMDDDFAVPRAAFKSKKRDREFFWVDYQDGKKLKPIILPNGKHYRYTLGQAFERRYYIERFVPNSRNIIFSESETDTLMRLVEVDPKDGKVVKVIAQDDSVSLGNYEDYFSTYISHNYQSFAGYRYFHSSYKSKWLTEDYRNVQSALDAKFPDAENVTIHQCNNDVDWCFVNISNSIGLEQSYLFTFKEGKAKFTLFDSRVGERDKYVMYSPEVIEHEGQAKNKILTYYYQPPKSRDKNEKVEALVIMPCPGPFFRWAGLFNAEAQFFATRQVAVATVNGRGCSGAGRENLFGEPGKLLDNMSKDIVSTAEFLKLRKELKDVKMFLYSSDDYGSLVALTAIRGNEGLFSGASVFSAPLDLWAAYKVADKEDYTLELSFLNLHDSNGYPLKRYLKDHSLFNYIKKASVPILYSYTDYNDDGLVPKLAKKLEKSKSSKLKVQKIKGFSYSLSSDSSRAYFAESSLSFFRRQL